MRFTVKTPAEDYTGEVAGVHFAKGVAEVDSEEHRDALRYFRSAGYTVEPVEEEPSEPQKPAQSASKADWVAWAVHKGMSAEDADALNKPDLIAKLAELEAAAAQQPPATPAS